MAKKKIDLRISVMLRFVRVIIPQLVVSMPIIIAFVSDNQRYMPLWVMPVVAFIGSLITALDKLRRELDKQK